MEHVSMASEPPLSMPGLWRGMAEALPTHHPGDESSDVASTYEVVALLAHAYFAALRFRLVGFDEDKTLEECVKLAPRLPPQWNSGFGSLSFVYRHKQSSMRFVLRVDRMGANYEVRGLAVGDEKIYRFQGKTKDLVVAGNLPLRIKMTEGREDRADLWHQMGKLLNRGSMEAFIRSLREEIVEKLIPKLTVEGYVETGTGTPQQRRDQPAFAEPLDPNGRRPYQDPRLGVIPVPAYGSPYPVRPAVDFRPPEFEDEHQVINPRPFANFPGGVPPNIGADDLNPPSLGRFDPLRPSNAGRPGYPSGGLSGMYPTFDDPLFTGQRGGYQGQGQYNPQVPPGARWDPVGPGGGPRFDPSRVNEWPRQGEEGGGQDAQGQFTAQFGFPGSQGFPGWPQGGQGGNGNPFGGGGTFF